MRSKESNKPFRVGIVGASTLKGKEVKSALAERKYPVSKLVLMDSDENLGRLTEFDGEPAFSLVMSESSLDSLDVVFFAGDLDMFLKCATLAKQKNFLMVDLSHTLWKDSGFPLYLPGIQGELPSLPVEGGIVCCPHAAVIAIATILLQLNSRYKIDHCVVNAFEPASERGVGGIEELKQQAIDLFSFQKVAQQVFDSQLAFNLLSRLGIGAKERLLDVEEEMATQLRVLLRDIGLLPSLTLIQVPVFHSHAFSFCLQVDPSVEVSSLEKALESAHISVIQTEDEPPTPVQVAGSDVIQIGGVKRDFMNPHSVWFWAVADNLRLMALNAVSAAEHYLLK